MVIEVRRASKSRLEPDTRFLYARLAARNSGPRDFPRRLTSGGTSVRPRSWCMQRNNPLRIPPAWVKRTSVPLPAGSNLKIRRVPLHSFPVSHDHSKWAGGWLTCARRRYTVCRLKKPSSTTPPLSVTSAAHHWARPCAVETKDRWHRRGRDLDGMENVGHPYIQPYG